MTESWFLAVAVVVLGLSLAGAAVAASDADAGDPTVEGWTPDVPDVHAAEEPTDPGVATIGDREYDSLQAALDDAEPGDTIVLEGRFEERVTVETPGVSLEATTTHGALVDGGGAGTVVNVSADDVTLDGLWVHNSGYERSAQDTGLLVNGSGVTLVDVRVTEVTFGIWIGEATDVTVENATIVGRAEQSQSERGNGIHLDRAEDAVLRDNHITTVRDGIYYSWSDGVVTERNVMWDLRYGVHYMYSDDNRLEENVAFDNDVGFALMVSENLTIANNTAVNNAGPSGQGILVKDVDDSEIRGNALVANRNGLYVYNAHRNLFADNLLLENEVGMHVTAGSSDERVVGNSFIGNGQAAHATTNSQVAWNGTAAEGGNYWADARAIDLDGDGTSEIRHQPAGTVERLVHENPQARAFAASPAFDAVRLAESSFPVVESPGVVDHHPRADPPHEDWRTYYEHHDH